MSDPSIPQGKLYDVEEGFEAGYINAFISLHLFN